VREHGGDDGDKWSCVPTFDLTPDWPKKVGGA